MPPAAFDVKCILHMCLGRRGRRKTSGKPFQGSPQESYGGEQVLPYFTAQGLWEVAACVGGFEDDTR